MIALLLCLTDAPALTVPRTVFADSRVVVPEAVLAWPGNAVVRIEERDGELVARFDQMVTSDRIAAFREAAGDAIGEALASLAGLDPDALRDQRAEKFAAIGRGLS